MKKFFGTIFGTTIQLLNKYLFKNFQKKIVIQTIEDDSNIFDGRKLEYNESGYYYVYPKFTAEELHSYYKNLYLNSFRLNVNFGIMPQDFFHFQILNETIPNFTELKQFLNFGSGHGGVSHILDIKIEDCEIVNIDPTQSPVQLAETNIRHELYLNTLKDNCIDLIYSSHSLEHVSDVDETLQEFKRVLKPGGYIFLEVPNADHPEDGPQMGKIDIPHTYYFQKKFFIENFDIKFIETLNMDRFNVKNWRNNIEENGRVIVTLMQIKK